MGSHPINLALRFILEIVALVSVGYWGFKLQDNRTKYLLGIGLPILLAVIWGTFAVPDDPSRSGQTVIATPGFLRLILELAIFGLGVWAFYKSDLTFISFVFLGIVLTHYIISYDRIIWLLKH